MSKRQIVTVVWILAAMGLVGCNPIYVNHDYDKGADFGRYQTYSWLEIPEQTPQNASEAQRTSPLMAKRIRSGIDRELTAKGLREVDDGGDLEVIYYLDARRMMEIQQNTYSGMDVWANSRVGGALNVRDVTEGTIIIDLLDGASQHLVWRGIAENARREDAPQQQINETVDKAIEKVFRGYPPK